MASVNLSHEVHKAIKSYAARRGMSCAAVVEAGFLALTGQEIPRSRTDREAREARDKELHDMRVQRHAVWMARNSERSAKAERGRLSNLLYAAATELEAWSQYPLYNRRQSHPFDAARQAIDVHYREVVALRGEIEREMVSADDGTPQMQVCEQRLAECDARQAEIASNYVKMAALRQAQVSELRTAAHSNDIDAMRKHLPLAESIMAQVPAAEVA